MRLLITGATGLVGRNLCALCQSKGHEVYYLTTRKEKIEVRAGYHGFLWNPAKGEIDKNCLRGVDKIIHLAGASVAKRWTPKYRKTIKSSRIDSAACLYRLLGQMPHQITQFISASAIGIYPSSLSHLYDESAPEKATDYLGEVVQAWEAAADQFKNLSIKVTKVRIGLVLAADGGMFPTLKRTTQYGLGATLGSGNQWNSWIHIEDLVRLFLEVAEQGEEDVFNAVAPNPVRQIKIVKTIAKQVHRPLWLPAIPSWVLKTALGEMATMVLGSQRVVNRRNSLGFSFQFNNIDQAVADLLRKY